MSDTDNTDRFERMDIDPITTDRGSPNNQDTDDEERLTHSLDDEQNNSTTDDDSSQDEPAQPKRVAPAGDTAPPRRDLPFAKRTGGPVKTAPIQPREDVEETAGETDDDEL